MKTSTKIILGIIILLAALGILSYAFMPTLSIFTVALWKWFVLAILIYWIVKLIGFGSTLGNRLSFIFPLALIFIVFENDIAKVFGLAPDFVNRWLILLGAVLIVAAFQLMFSKKRYPKKFGNQKVNQTVNQNANSQSRVYEESPNTKTFSMGSNVCYVDASTQRNAKITNSMGELDVFYQNADVGDTNVPLTLTVDNKLGETRVHIPKDWYVNAKMDNALGEIDIRDNPETSTRTIEIDAKNRLGEIRIVSIV